MMMHLTRCNYESIADNDWLNIVIDFDELLVPQDGSKAYQEFMRNLLRKNSTLERHAMYTANARNYYTSYEPDESQTRHLPLLRYNQHGYSGVLPYKTMRRPHACVASQMHQCMVADGYKARQLVLSAKQMVNYHFRSRCKNVAVNCSAESLVKHRNNFLAENFGADLRRRVEKVLKELDFDVNF